MIQRLTGRLRLLTTAVAITVTASGAPVAATQTTPADDILVGNSAPALRVSGNRLIDAQNRPVVLHGVNRSGSEFRCTFQGVNGNVFDGPTDDASIAAITSWTGVNTVRIPLNEACWLGLQGVDPTASGHLYRAQIKEYVDRLHRHGLVVILDLHWTTGSDSGPGVLCTDANAVCQKSMPDAAYAPALWSSVAEMFRDDPSTVFDVFNEPFHDVAHRMTKPQAWRCWRDGGTACPGFRYSVTGMQSLVDAVRKTGAKNVIMLGGLTWSHDLTGWLQHKPKDPAGNLAASWHAYNFNACITESCWNRELAPVASKVPLITGEIGQDNCRIDFVDKVMTWFEKRNLSYLAWTWNTYASCAKSPILIKDYNGTPTVLGKAVKDHLARLSRR